ncbi:hypothetical protein T11_11015 [Trichinella zimbabwensis]|uniref:Uncharacterized protein n=1 Tax=Trichinella zimbabwensis TaxID=268475 RepID=A0A0V1HF19_9BILA|nr:hypothetical protein T11_11015 [Trichinella zimbabwensis]
MCNYALGIAKKLQGDAILAVVERYSLPFSPLLILDQIHFTFTFNCPFFNLYICSYSGRIHVVDNFLFNNLASLMIRMCLVSSSKGIEIRLEIGLSHQAFRGLGCSALFLSCGVP